MTGEDQRINHLREIFDELFRPFEQAQQRIASEHRQAMTHTEQLEAECEYHRHVLGEMLSVLKRCEAELGIRRDFVPLGPAIALARPIQGAIALAEKTLRGE